jgi:hypothetical protein
MDETKVGRVFRRVLRGAALAAFRVYDLRQRRCWPIWNQKWNQTGLSADATLRKCLILNGAGGGI